jgi:branched-chain amino acid transport system ATP-binding protein
MGNILEVSGLTKKFGGLNAVNDVNFRVQEGMRLGIIGPNGAGKTTLFGMIAGEIKPTSGFIQFAGKRVHGLKPHRISRMGIGRTFQLVRVFDELSVYDNVLTGIIAQRLQFSPNIDRRNEVDRILELTYLQDRRDTLAKNLTVAWKKRVCLATALATKPKLLLLDELMAGLTFVEIDETLTLLREINAEMEITLIVVEHVMRAVMELCEEILVISSGEKIASGTPQEIANNKRVIHVYLGEEKR